MPDPEKTVPIVDNDQPTAEDKLNREQYAKAFAKLVETCKTPLVIGLYGTWGIGKTSLMKQIAEELDTTKARAVWFDPWQHQFDENPVVALAHILFAKLDVRAKEEAKKLLTVIAAAFGSMLLEATTGLKAKDLLRFGEVYEEKRFQVRDARVQLREHFKTLVEKATNKGRVSKRLVFFIDDLDRCMPGEALKLLEALKLYLDIEDCVYFLGVDRDALENSIRHRYEGLEIKEAEYLDKIVQLPFHIPPIEPQCMADFIEPLLLEDLQSCRDLLVEGLGDNPRQVKQFINILTLNHQLSLPLKIPNYNPQVVALMLLIQRRARRLYDRIAREPELLQKLKEGFKDESTTKLFETFLVNHPRLRKAIKVVELPDVPVLKTYIFLTKTASVAEEVERSESRPNLSVVLKKHALWVNSEGMDGEKANLRWVYLSGADLSKADLSKADLSGANLYEANLYEANLRGANLGSVDLRGGHLGSANLSGAFLLWANLRGAFLRGAFLRGAFLGGAALSEADLSGADLSGADLSGADLSGAAVTEAQLAVVITDEETVFPNGNKRPTKKEEFEMNLWINEIEPKIRKLYNKEIGNSGDLVIFKITDNMECEIQKDDGSRTRIPRKIIHDYETDQNARQVLLEKLRDFKVPESI